MRACILIKVWCENKTPDSNEKPSGVVRVRLIGLEPTRRETPDPKSGASTNSATSASRVYRNRRFPTCVVACCGLCDSAWTGIAAKLHFFYIIYERNGIFFSRLRQGCSFGSISRGGTGKETGCVLEWCYMRTVDSTKTHRAYTFMLNLLWKKDIMGGFVCVVMNITLSL